MNVMLLVLSIIVVVLEVVILVVVLRIEDFLRKNLTFNPSQDERREDNIKEFYTF